MAQSSLLPALSVWPSSVGSEPGLDPLNTMRGSTSHSIDSLWFVMTYKHFIFYHQLLKWSVIGAGATTVEFIFLLLEKPK